MRQAGLQLLARSEFPSDKLLRDPDHRDLADWRVDECTSSPNDALRDDHPRAQQVVLWLDPPALLVRGHGQEGAGASSWAWLKWQLDNEGSGWVAAITY
jgi:hypothetical protein